MESETEKLNSVHCLSLSYNPLTEEVPEIFSIEGKNKKSKLSKDILKNKLKGSFEKLVFVKTCQRFELYVISKTKPGDLKEYLAIEYRKYFADGYDQKIKLLSGKDCLIHLAKLASGLESFIKGEAEIYHQAKELFNKYRNDGRTDEYLDRVFEFCLSVSKDVREAVFDDNIVHSYPELLIQFTSIKNIPFERIVIIGDGLLAKSLKNSLLKKETQIETFKYISNIEIEDSDLIVNCDSKTKIQTLNRLHGNLLVDFSIPPVLESYRGKGKFFSIQDFADLISENNKVLSPYVAKAEGMIHQKIDKWLIC